MNDLFDGVKRLRAQPGWLRTLCVYSLLAYIPIIGPFAYAGTIYDFTRNLIQGRDELPRIGDNLWKNTVRGFIVTVPNLVVVVLSMATFGLGGLLMIPLAILMPGMLANFLVRGETFEALIDVRSAWDHIKYASDEYLKYWVVRLVLSLASSVPMVPMILLMFFVEFVVIGGVLGAVSAASGSGDASGAAAIGVLLTMCIVLLFAALVSLALGVLFLVVNTFIAVCEQYYLAAYARRAYPEATAAAPEVVPVASA